MLWCLIRTSSAQCLLVQRLLLPIQIRVFDTPAQVILHLHNISNAADLEKLCPSKGFQCSFQPSLKSGCFLHPSPPSTGETQPPLMVCLCVLLAPYIVICHKQQIIMLCPVTDSILFNKCNLRSGPAVVKAIFSLLIPAGLTKLLLAFLFKIPRQKYWSWNGLEQRDWDLHLLLWWNPGGWRVVSALEPLMRLTEVKGTWPNSCLVMGMDMKVNYRNWWLSPVAFTCFLCRWMKMLHRAREQATRSSYHLVCSSF